MYILFYALNVIRSDFYFKVVSAFYLCIVVLISKVKRERVTQVVGSSTSCVCCVFWSNGVSECLYRQHP